MKLCVTLSVLALLVSGAWSAPATQQTKQSSKATLDFIAHEQASGAAEAATAAPPKRPSTTTTSPPRSPSRLPSSASDTQQTLQQHTHQQRVNASGTPGTPKRDWELVPPPTRQAYVPPQPPRQPPTSRPMTPTTQRATYAGVVKDQRQGQDRATTPRVYNIPISVEPGYTTSTEASRWYDKLFGKSVDADDSPWGRRRRQVALGAAPGSGLEPRSEQRSEIVIGSNALHVARPRTPSRAQSAHRDRGSAPAPKDSANLA